VTDSGAALAPWLGFACPGRPIPSPLASCDQLISAVLEDVRLEVSAVFQAAQTNAGLGHAIRHGLHSYWAKLVLNDPTLALMRHELCLYALRTPGLENQARWKIEGYTRIVAEWSQQAASNAGEICAVPFDTLARALVGGVMGTVLEYLSDHDRDRSQQNLEALTQMLVALAAVRPATPTADA
jgi:hypothetical protein